jgi:hypothetical protein
MQNAQSTACKHNWTLLQGVRATVRTEGFVRVLQFSDDDKHGHKQSSLMTRLANVEQQLLQVNHELYMHQTRRGMLGDIAPLRSLASPNHTVLPSELPGFCSAKSSGTSSIESTFRGTTDAARAQASTSSYSSMATNQLGLKPASQVGSEHAHQVSDLLSKHTTWQLHEHVYLTT